MKQKEILIELFRYSSGKDSTQGVFLIRGNFQSDSLEDESRVKKEMKETRIRAGVWPLKIRKQLTPLTKKYRARYSWFEYFIEVISPEFTGTYLHNGTTDDHTAGCPLMGERKTLNTHSNGTLFSETKESSMKRFYEEVYEDIKKGEKDYFIRIVDLDAPRSM